MKEKYIPSSEEVKKAEEMMTPKEKEMSEEREATLNEGARRQIPTQEVKKDKKENKNEKAEE